MLVVRRTVARLMALKLSFMLGLRDIPNAFSCTLPSAREKAMDELIEPGCDQARGDRPFFQQR